MTRILPASDPAALAEAARVLRAGGLVAFPTETVYGLGADALDARAVVRIFEAKRRPAFDPLIVPLAGAGELRRVVAAVPRAAERLAERFWPGPLTLVLPRLESLPDIVTSGLPSVGVRVPDHPAARALIAAAGTPVAAPSANPFGYVSPTTAAHVAELLGDAVELVLDGGPCRVGVESTIVSLLQDPPALLNPGGLLFVRVPALRLLWGAHDEAVLSRHRYTRGELRALLQGSGLELLRASYCNSLLFPLLLAHRALDAHEAGPELVLGELAHRPDAAVAEVVDVVDHALAVADRDQRLEYVDDVLAAEHALPFHRVAAQAAVELHAPDLGEVVALGRHRVAARSGVRLWQ